MNAFEIALKYGYESMKSILQNHCISSVYEKTIPTFQPYDNYNDNSGLCLLSVTLSSYKQAFHPAPIDPNKSVMSVLLDIFKDLCTNKDRWKKVRDVVSDSVFPVSGEQSQAISNCSNRRDFFKQVVRAYTDEDISIYSYLNISTTEADRLQAKWRWSCNGTILCHVPNASSFLESENRKPSYLQKNETFNRRLRTVSNWN